MQKLLQQNYKCNEMVGIIGYEFILTCERLKVE